MPLAPTPLIPWLHIWFSASIGSAIMRYYNYCYGENPWLAKNLHLHRAIQVDHPRNTSRVCSVYACAHNLALFIWDLRKSGPMSAHDLRQRCFNELMNNSELEKWLKYNWEHIILIYTSRLWLFGVFYLQCLWPIGLR